MNEKDFDLLIQSVKEGGKILRGEKQTSRTFEVSPLDIKRIRNGYQLSQSQFAALLGVSVRTLQNWEQGRRVPEGPAMVLLRVAEKYPEALLNVVQSTG